MGPPLPSSGLARGALQGGLLRSARSGVPVVVGLMFGSEVSAPACSRFSSALARLGLRRQTSLRKGIGGQTSADQWQSDLPSC